MSPNRFFYSEEIYIDQQLALNLKLSLCCYFLWDPAIEILYKSNLIIEKLTFVLS